MVNHLEEDILFVCRYLEIDLTRDSWGRGVFSSVLTCVCVCLSHGLTSCLGRL